MNTRFSPPLSKEEFSAMVSDIESTKGYVRPAAFALGLATLEDDKVVAVTYTITNYESSYGTAAVLAAALGFESTGIPTGEYLLTPKQVRDALGLFRPFIGEAGHGNITTLTHMNDLAKGDSWKQPSFVGGLLVNERVPILGVIQSWKDKPVACADTYLRLYAISEGKRKRSDAQISAIEKMLPVVVESDQLGIFTVDEWRARKEQFVYRGATTAIRAVYKIPRLVDHIVTDRAYKADPDQLFLGDSE